MSKENVLGVAIERIHQEVSYACEGSNSFKSALNGIIDVLNELEIDGIIDEYGNILD